MLTRRAMYFQLVGFAVAACLLFWLWRFFPVIDFVDATQRRVTSWGALGALCYPFLFALCNVLLLPGGILCVGAGFFFGLWWGFFLVFVGNAISAAVSFVVSRWMASHWFKQRFSRSSMLRALELGVEREGWKIVLLSQLHPLFPVSLVNYLYGLTRIRFRSYMCWVAIGRAPGLFLYVYLGTLGQYGFNLVRGRSHPRMIEYWIWGGAFVVTALLVLVVSRIASRAINSAYGTNIDSGKSLRAAEPKLYSQIH